MSFTSLLQTPSTTTITMLGLAAIVVLICLSAFFSSSEIALFSLPYHRTDVLVEDGKPGAEMVRTLKENPHRLLVTILVGNNIVNIATSSIATGLLAFYLPSGQAVLVATFGVTSLVLLFGESAPKSYAVEHTESWALTIARPLKLAEYVLFPLVVLFDYLTRQVNRLTGGRAALEEQYITREEIAEMIDAGEREGAIAETEHELFRRLFRFRSRLAKNAMTPRSDIAAVGHDSSVESAISVCLDSGHDRLPVYNDTLDTVVGIVRLHDLISSSRSTQSNAPDSGSLRECVRPTMHTLEGKVLDELLIDMREARVELAIVVDEFGTTEGVITLEDITEEIVGEILEKTEIRPIESLDHRTVLVRGDVDINLINETLELSLPVGEEYSTIAGFVLDQAGRVIEEGDEIQYEDLTFRINRADGPRIQRIRIVRNDGPTD